MTAFKPIKEGKVREIYDNGDSLIMALPEKHPFRSRLIISFPT